LVDALRKRCDTDLTTTEDGSFEDLPMRPAAKKPRPTKMKIEWYSLIAVKLPIHAPPTPIENNVKGIIQQVEAPIAIRKLPMAVEL